MSAPPIPDAEQSVEARAIGPYSIVTELPLGGQPITSLQIDWLFDRGLAGLLSDFAMLKCDVVGTRRATYETLFRSETIEFPGRLVRSLSLETPSNPSLKNDTLVSARLWRLTLLLGCLGIGLSLSDGRLALRYESPNDPSQWSFGEVTRAETFDETTKEPIFEGLFCPRIFGKKTNRRMGHIELASPLVPVHLRTVVLALLGEDGSRLLESIYLDGAIELENALTEVDLDARLATLPMDHPKRDIIDAMRMTGIAARELLWRVMPVLPPSHRPLTPLADGRWARSDVTDLYFRLMESNLRCRQAIQDKESIASLRSKRASLAIAMDELLVDGNRTQRPAKPLRSIIDVALERFRLPGEQKTDFSGRAVVRIDPARKSVGAPKAMLEELCRPIAYGEIERRGLCKTIQEAKVLFDSNAELRGDISAQVFKEWPVLLTMGESFVGALVEPIDENIFRLPPQIAARVGIEWDGNALTLHLPLNEVAKKEALHLKDEEPAVQSQTNDGLLSSLPEDREAALEICLLAAFKNEVDASETSAIAFLVGGSFAFSSPVNASGGDEPSI